MLSEAPTSGRAEARVAASFRDPAGFVFRRDGVLYRRINPIGLDDYDHLMRSGLYDALTAEGMLIPHREANSEVAGPGVAIQPDAVPLISYPYEWCFSQLKAAALATLRLQAQALDFGMTLKDASAYNIQFLAGKPVLIDTLSLQRGGNTPWAAYGQFCRHFLAPLALMSYCDVRLGGLLRVHLDGIPLDLAAGLLPFRARLRPSLLTHLFLHARSQKRPAGGASPGQPMLAESAVRGLLDHLRSAVEGLTWRPAGTEWGDYYAATNYSDAAFVAKKRIVSRYLDWAQPETVWDLGANTGVFSRLASERGLLTAAFDCDPAAVEKNYQQAVAEGDRHLLPLVLDLTNPSPGIGWASGERDSLASRGPVDTVLALALVHHLAISNNVPLGHIAAFLHGLCRTLIIEFVPKHDSQVQRLLASRGDVFPDYTPAVFEAAFGRYFVQESVTAVDDSARAVYLFRRREMPS